MELLGEAILEMISSYHRMMYSFQKTADHEYSKNQMRMMMILFNKNEGYNMSCLGKAMGLPKGSMTSIVDSLEELNLAERKFSKKDRRVTEVLLTENGKKIVNARLQLLEKFIKEKLADDSAAKENLMKGLAETKEIFDRCTGDK